MRRSFVLVLLAILFTTPIRAQDFDVPERLTAVVRPDAVTVYRGRAAVTRTFDEELSAGTYTLVFSDLPETVRPDSVHARVRGAARTMAVEYLARPGLESGSPELRRLDVRLRELEEVRDDFVRERTLLVAQRTFFEQIAIRAAAAAAGELGTADLDLDALRKHYEFINAEQARIAGAIGVSNAKERDTLEQLEAARAERAQIAGDSKTRRSAEVTLDVLASGQITVELTYFVDGAAWAPVYDVRAETIGVVQIDYHASLSQRTGEDWTNVLLTLSTAQPMQAAKPPVLSPWYVDLFEPALRGATSGAARSVSAPPASKFGVELDRIVAGADVRGAGPSITFTLPRRVSVPTDAERDHRTRIGTIDAGVSFIHVAVPLLTDTVYVRGRLENRSAYHLLAGRASIFVDQDYVGSTALEGIAPNESFELYFGIDPAVTAKRTMIDKSTGKTGLLGGGRRTRYAFRIEIENHAGKTIDLELNDRRPVSRSDQIAVVLVDLSHPLETDPTYEETDLPAGLLRWRLAVPPSPVGADGPEFVITYGLDVTRGKDVEMTPLPE